MSAAGWLWRRYFDALVRLARVRLGPRPAAADEEDVALSAFHSLWPRAGRGRFAQLDGRDDLWRLLVMITVPQGLDQAQRQRRQKRGGGRVLGEADLAGAGPGGDGGGLDWVAGDGRRPTSSPCSTSSTRLLVEGLPDPSLREVARLRLEGYDGREIAERLGCNRRTVVRKLERIRRTWSEAFPP